MSRISFKNHHSFSKKSKFKVYSLPHKKTCFFDKNSPIWADLIAHDNGDVPFPSLCSPRAGNSPGGHSRLFIQRAVPTETHYGISIRRFFTQNSVWTIGSKKKKASPEPDHINVSINDRTQSFGFVSSSGGPSTPHLQPGLHPTQAAPAPRGGPAAGTPKGLKSHVKQQVLAPAQKGHGNRGS